MNPNLLKGCAPIFKEGFCCPVDWMCPLPIEEPRLITIQPPNAPLPPSVAIGSSVRCPPGVNPRADYRDYLIPPTSAAPEIEVDKLGTRVSFFERESQ